MIYEEMQVDVIAMQAISDIIGDVYDYSDEDKDEDHMRIAALAEISGAVKLAESIKAAIKEAKGAKTLQILGAGEKNV